MALVRVHKVVLGGYITDGQQAVPGNLDIAGPIVIELDPSVYNRAGTYILFSYGSFDDSQLSNIEIDASDIDVTVISGPTNVPSKKIITITLG